MNDENVIKEARAGGRDWRVRLLVDESPEEPYNEGSVPLWRVEYSGLGWRTEQVKTTTNYDASHVRLSDAVNQFGGPTKDILSRWLRAYHGVTIVEHWHNGSFWYIAADDESWRKEMGVTSEQITEEYSEGGSLMPEYKAWCAGDVHGFVIEQRVVTYTTVVEPADGKIIGSRKGEEWIPADDGDATLYGLYGYEYAVKQAAHELDVFVRDLDRREHPERYETITLVSPGSAN